MYDLGADGRDMRKVAEVTNFAQAAERAAGGRDIFGGRSSADRKVDFLTSLVVAGDLPTDTKIKVHR